MNSDPASSNSHEKSCESTVAFRQALVLWLRWNDAYERVTSEMYKDAGDSDRIETLLQQVDELRVQAVAASRKLLSE